MVKVSSVFDGDVNELEKFVNLIKVQRHNMFRDPNNNVLCDGVLFEEDILRINYEGNKNEFENKIFFKTQTQNYFLEFFENDVVLFGGIDPWETVESNQFTFLLDSISLTNAILSFFLMILLTN